MKKFIFKLFVISMGIGGLLLGGCGETSVKPAYNKYKKPEWILNPNLNGKVGAVGVAATTYDQKISTQRKLAIQRALDELALQQGVKVELDMNKKEHIENDTLSTSMDVKSSYKTTNNTKMKAHIEAIWQDPSSDEIYIWLVLDK
jgi:hypothetical protein